MACILCGLHLGKELAEEYPERRYDYCPTDSGTFEPVCYGCLDSMVKAEWAGENAYQMRLSI